MKSSRTASFFCGLLNSIADFAGVLEGLRHHFGWQPSSARARLLNRTQGNHQWVQSVDATVSASLAAGVMKPRVFLGQVLSWSATASRSPWLYPVRSAPLGEVLTQQPVGVFIAASLPWTLRIAEVDVYVRGDRELLMVGKFSPAIPGQRRHQSSRQMLRSAMRSAWP